MVVACGAPTARLFHTTLAYPDGGYPLPVTLGDRTNLVIGIDPGSRRQDRIARCEDESIVSFWLDDDRYWLTVASRSDPDLVGGCPAIGLPRAIRIKTSEPVAVDRITITDGL